MAWIEIWAKSRGQSVCRSCGAPIEWAEIVASGKKMPFDGEIVAIATKQDPATGKAIDVVDLTVTKSHFATCKQANKWRRGDAR